jgi:hypothetical protein
MVRGRRANILASCAADMLSLTQKSTLVSFSGPPGRLLAGL